MKRASARGRCAIGLAICAVLAAACSGSGPAAPSAVPGLSAAAPTAEPVATSAPSFPTRTAGRIAELEARLRAAPDDGPAYRDLGAALLQRARETGDPSLYDRADLAFGRARTLLPDDPYVVVGIGTLQLARHQFAAALLTGQAATRIEPHLPEALGVQVDALVELGRYDEATATLQEMVDRKPGLASYARVSYVRELHGDLPGALETMVRAQDAGTGMPENDAYVAVLVGHLDQLLGRPDEAARAYDHALDLVPDYPQALAGQGRAAVAAGDLATAIARFSRAADIIPLPEYVIALGEAQEAMGDVVAARRSYDLVRVEARLLRASGVVVDLELATFEADHGDPMNALALAQAAYRERPTVKAADALAWALFRTGRTAEAVKRSREALRLGTKDPAMLYHAGAILAAAGNDVAAQRDLDEALRLDAGFSATGSRAARALLARLG
jgi:Flp pilus assembly protein TadD